MPVEVLESLLGPSIEDAAEETFLLFSQDLPTNNLGFVDQKAENLEFEIDGNHFEFYQSPGLLISNREAGTTGAVLWKISPKVAAWLTSIPGILTSIGALHSNATVVELGCGITGIIGLVLASKVHQYILTDQSYVLKNLKKNLNNNMEHLSRHKKGLKKSKTPVCTARDIDCKLKTMILDWEKDSVENLKPLLTPSSGVIDLVIVCDCVYNEYLIQPLVQTCSQLSQLHHSKGKSTFILIAQQLRSDDIFNSFLESLIASFHVWRIPDQHLSEELRSGSGYAIHLAKLKT